jgi:hypothetical protein
MLSRRELIGKAAVGAAAAVAVGGVVGTAMAATRPRQNSDEQPEHPTKDAADDRSEPPPAPVADAAPAPWALVAPFGVGAVVAGDWRLADLTPVRDGSAVATLANPRGRVQRIHLCRNDGHPQGMIYTRRVDLVVMNQGYGELPTEEHFGQAVAALAHAIAANESATDAVAALQPHAERVQRYATVTDASADGRLR